MKGGNILKKKVLGLAILLVSIFLCSCCGNLSNKDKNSEEVVKNIVNSFLEEIKNSTPENRKIDKIFQMLHYEDSDEKKDIIRKDSFKEIEIKDFKILNVLMLHKDIYCIETKIDSDNEIEEPVIFYVVKIQEDWKIVLGAHNLPQKIANTLQKEKIEIPVTPISEGTKIYSLDQVVF